MQITQITPSEGAPISLPHLPWDDHRPPLRPSDLLRMMRETGDWLPTHRFYAAFPYASERRVYTALQRLVERGDAWCSQRTNGSACHTWWRIKDGDTQPSLPVLTLGDNVRSYLDDRRGKWVRSDEIASALGRARYLISTSISELVRKGIVEKRKADLPGVIMEYRVPE